MCQSLTYDTHTGTYAIEIHLSEGIDANNH